MERVPYGQKINGNLIRCHLQGFGENPVGFKKIDPVAENRVLAHENGPKWTVSRSHKIRNRLARRPTLVVLCLKLRSVLGGGTVTVTKCVILAP
jgi:hypothetical protein